MSRAAPPSVSVALSPLMASLAFVIPFLSVLVVGMLNAWQSHVEQLQTSARAVEQRVSDVSESSAALVNALSAVYQSQAQFSAAQITGLAETIMRQYEHIELITFANWVSESRRAEFEQHMREEGYPTFRIRASAPHVVMQREAGYLPIRFVEPYRPEFLSLLGVDLASGGQHASRLRNLVKAGKVEALPDLLLDDRQASLVHLARATYRGVYRPDKASDRLLQGDGVFVLTVNLDKVVDPFRRPDSGYRYLVATRDNSAPFTRSLTTGFTGELATPLILKLDVPLRDGHFQLRIERLLDRDLILVPTSIVFAMVMGLLGVMLAFQLKQRHAERIARIVSERLLEHERKQAQATLKSIADAVIVADAGLHVEYINPVAEKLLGCDNDKARGRPVRLLLRLFHAEDKTPLRDIDGYLGKLSEGRMVEEVLLLTDDRGHIHIDSRISPMSGDRGGMVIVMRDVSRERQLTRELAFQASHDQLTGLLNRSAFASEAKVLISRAHGTSQVHGLLFVDLDRFKLVNDTSGHQAGDELLKMVAELLQSELREGDILARMGGDEFAILLYKKTLPEAGEVAKRLRSRLEAFRFVWQDRVFDIRASFGVIPVLPDYGTYEDMMAYADLACHAAKESGRNNIYTYEPDDQVIELQRNQMQWLPRLRNALENDEFVLHVQPMIPVPGDNLRPRINEFLLRLDEQGRDIPPGLFLPAAERYDLMPEVDRWVVRHALQKVSGVLAEDNSLYSINLSGQTLGDSGFARWIAKQCEAVGVPTRRICLEITETMAIANLATAAALIHELREYGFRIMLDDFGSGMSSFGYLSNLRVDLIKIDGQFVRDIVKDRLAQSMVRMICEIASVLRVETVAEMVETEEAVEMVSDIGVDYLQGYYISRPAPMSAAAADSERPASA